MILLFSDVNLYRYIPEDYTVFTLGFTINGEPSINTLTPKRLLYSNSYEEFEEVYYKYIMEYNDTFLDFMNIIYELYKGNNVCIIIDYRFDEQFVTALSKIIAKRYGLISSLAIEYDDLYSISETSFSKIGLRVLDADKASMSYQLKALELQDPRLMSSFKYHNNKSMEKLYSVRTM